MPPPDPAGFDLDRFVAAQAAAYATALGELRAGRKRTHWIWFVFPQLAGLGVSATSRQYALSGVAEARAYLAHPVLGPRLREAINAMLVHREASAATILGELDAMKFRSCLTLFARAAPAEPLFAAALERFFDAGPDPATLRLLSTSADT
jgi:uncharacterized protein (DUF1810 family)